jgi:hypothetical protein
MSSTVTSFTERRCPRIRRLVAGGKLTVNATIINQGTVRAPLGQIAFNATGSVNLLTAA